MIGPEDCRNICNNKTANCMWAGQPGHNQSICLNLTQQNGDKNFFCKTPHRFDWREGKMECLFAGILFPKSGLHWRLNKELDNKMMETDTSPGQILSSRWNISITERILENQMARFKLLENVRRGAARQERECQTLPTLALDRGAVGVLLASLKWFQFWQIDN